MAKPSSYERKRQEICSVAMEIFSAKGFEGTTLDAVAESLGYTKPALYYYFDSKEALFRSIVLDSLRDAASRIEAINAEPKPASEKLRGLIRMYLDDHFSQRGYFSFSHVLRDFRAKMPDGPERREIENLSAAIPRIIIGIIRQGVLAHEFIDEDPGVLGGLVIAMLSGVLIHLDMPALAGIDRDKLRSSLDSIIVKGISA